MEVKRPEIRGDLVARIELIRGDVPFQRYVHRLIEYALSDRFEPVAVGMQGADLEEVNELRAASREAGDTLASPLSR